jgi:hypothetical protein
LKPGGVVAINTPDASSLCARTLGASWHALCPPEHLALFGATSLEKLLEQSQLRMLESGKIGKSFTLQYIFKTLAYTQKSKLFGSLAGMLHGSAFGEIEIALNLRDNIFVLAQKLS